MQKRIIPISSGKGGVGKTTFAINLSLALSQFGKTVLVDLDTGTSSVRNVIDSPVERDLYHFFRRDVPLETCISSLSRELDPQGKFSRFGFVAAPKHLVDDIANMDRAGRAKLADGINRLPGEFIVLDLKAGIDPSVLDFLPHTNSGVLVFTPMHPAATTAAARIVKAIIFRRLRALFYPNSPIFGPFAQGRIDYSQMKRLIDDAEDAYKEDLVNLDAFFNTLNERYPGHPVSRLVGEMIRNFDVFYILNRFNGISRSYEQVIEPFVTHVAQDLSPQIRIQNLGWVVESEAYNQANTDRVPYLIRGESKPLKKRVDSSQRAIDAQLDALYEMSGHRQPVQSEPRAKPLLPKRFAVDTGDVLSSQLDSIQKLFDHHSHSSVVENFEYIVSRIRYALQPGMVSNLGDRKIYKPGDHIPLFPETN